MLKFWKAKIILGLALLPLLAQADPLGDMGGLDKAADKTGLIKRDLPEVVAIIINGLLLLLGTLFTVLLVVGGFRWMTSQGNSSQIETAKETIKNAFIGIVVVVISYAIVRFVFTVLAETAGGNSPQTI